MYLVPYHVSCKVRAFLDVGIDAFLPESLAEGASWFLSRAACLFSPGDSEH